jgi:DNA ligase D-like protein (predicted 3'-phosphoesterase)
VGLKEYRAKRDFRRTPEPAGKRSPRRGRRYVIQEHAASTHHYDFRLEVNGVLKSWSVPKGPSTDPRVKRLAVPTEDHPLDYAGFEGVIPEGYGAGTVIVWDAGTYENLREDASMSEAYDEGKLEFELFGKKLRGGFVLVRTSGDRSWLLMKKKDASADARRRPTVTEPLSVVSGKTLDEVAEAESDSG